MANHRVVYRPPHISAQLLDDQTAEGLVGSISRAERQEFPQRPIKWWYQEGPVDNCCCCFQLRTGTILLSLDNFFSGVSQFVYVYAAQRFARQKLEFATKCSEGDASEPCTWDAHEFVGVDFVVSIAPLIYTVAVALILFSVVGIKAASTGNPKLAKLYMKAYPFLAVFIVVRMVMRAVMAPSTITWMVQLHFYLEIFVIIYYTKVTWSFYKRSKAMMDNKNATNASSRGHTINLPVTQAPTIV